jgi:hypothetical protein
MDTAMEHGNGLGKGPECESDPHTVSGNPDKTDVGCGQGYQKAGNFENRLTCLPFTLMT